MPPPRHINVGSHIITIRENPEVTNDAGRPRGQIPIFGHITNLSQKPFEDNCIMQTALMKKEVVIWIKANKEYSYIKFTLDVEGFGHHQIRKKAQVNWDDESIKDYSGKLQQLIDDSNKVKRVEGRAKVSFLISQEFVNRRRHIGKVKIAKINILEVY